MPSQRVAYQQTFTSGGIAYSATMYSSSYGTYGPARGTFKRWYTCHVCGFDYPKDRVRLIHGTPYCVENMCYLEARKERRR